MNCPPTGPETQARDAVLFGPLGAMAAELCTRVCADAEGRQFPFLKKEVFSSLGLADVARIYWREMLFRVYVGAVAQLARHRRWQAGCVSSFAEPSNLLSFASNLRGLTESALDAWWTFRKVSGSLSRDRALIQAALAGRARQEVVAPELEDCLIHFLYGRKLSRSEGEVQPASHRALEPKDYRDGAGLPPEERDGFRALYDELCGICHPTAFSFTPTLRFREGGLSVGAAQDGPMILRLCEQYGSPIRTALSFGVTAPAVCLKLLNRFSLNPVASGFLERWCFDDVPLWRKAAAAMAETIH